MRTRLALLIVIAASPGCTRDNPAFESSGGGGDGSGGTAEDVSTSVEAGTEQSDAPGPVCELEGGDGMFIELIGPCNSDNATHYEKWHNVVMVDGSTMWVGLCDAGCGESCVDTNPAPLTIEPLALDTVIPVDACIRVTAERVPPLNNDSCEYENLVVEITEDGVFFQPLIIARNTLDAPMPAIEAQIHPALASFTPELNVVDFCSCQEYPDDCCDGLAPTVYAFGIGQPALVPIDGMANLMLDQFSYLFEVFDAFQTGECGRSPRVSWALSKMQ